MQIISTIVIQAIKSREVHKYIANFKIGDIDDFLYFFNLKIINTRL